MKRWICLSAAIAALCLTGLAAASETEATLTDPTSWTQQAPESFLATFETSKGTFVIEVRREWAPSGADRFYNLVSSGFYDDTRFFRVVRNFVVQWGLNGDPAVTQAWMPARIPADAVKQTNERGMVTFAQGRSPDTRTTQVFINLKDNKTLDGMNFSPFGKVVEGMDVVQSLYGGYGEGAPQGRGPSQGLIMREGNAYLKERFPKLDYIVKATAGEVDMSRAAEETPEP